MNFVDQKFVSVTDTDTSAVRDKSEASVQSSHTGMQWSALATDNRYGVLATTDDDDGSHDEQPFTLVRSQRSVRTAAKRQRQQSTAQGSRQPNQATPAVNTVRASQISGRQRARVITGQSSVVSQGVWAARKTVRKAVLCVDNVDLACNENDISAYVSSIGVEVFTCFQTNPRRRPNESVEDVRDRKAFRLCINAADRDRLYDSNAWPDSIRVSDWFSCRDKNSQTDKDGKRRRIDRSDRHQTAESSRESVASLNINQACTMDIGDGELSHQETNVVAPMVPTASDSACSEPAASSETRAGNDGDDDDDDDDDADKTTLYHDGGCE